MYYVYLLQSQRDKKLYTGYTENLRERLKEHNAGKNYSTKFRTPLKLIFYEAYPNKEDALRRERYLKTEKGKITVRLMLRSYFESGTWI